VKLVELYGAAIGCAIMAAVFAVLTLLTMAVVSGGQTAAESASAASADASAEEPAQIGSEFEGLFTPELRAVLGATAPMALPVVTRAVMRNLPVLIMLALIIYVFSRFAKSSDETDSDAAQAMAAPPAA
jgi:Na+-transporting methylmalonyl-CoA/oxaloacetate decarboxylase gamma subunit